MSHILSQTVQQLIPALVLMSLPYTPKMPQMVARSGEASRSFRRGLATTSPSAALDIDMDTDIFFFGKDPPMCILSMAASRSRILAAARMT